VRACALLAGSASLGCSTPTDAQPLEGECAPFAAETWQPADGAKDVPIDEPIRLVFDDYPDPDTVDYDGVKLTTGVFYQGGKFTVDLIDKSITLAPAGGYLAELGYNVNLLPGLRSLRSCPAPKKQISFRSGTSFLPKAPPPAPPATFADVKAIFARACAGGGCHRAQDGAGCLDQPAAALSLCDRDALAALVEVPSRQLARLSLVAAGDSSRSYLLRKLLAGARPDVPAPTALGHRDPPGAPLGDDDLRAIASWIDAGANP
jgi:Bacterial Ig-like domain